MRHLTGFDGTTLRQDIEIPDRIPYVYTIRSLYGENFSEIFSIILCVVYACNLRNEFSNKYLSFHWKYEN